jgi:carboxyl-terminal processing protease
VVNPFLDSLGVSHTRFFDARHHGYYMMKSLFGTRDLDAPAFSQLGLQFEQSQPDRIRSILNGLPADQAGLQRGDRILTVDGAPFRSLLDWRGAAPRALTIERPQKILTQTPARLAVTVTPVQMGMHRALLVATRNSVRTFGCGTKTIGYVKLWSGTDTRFLDTLKTAVEADFEAVDGLVLDLRDGYGGAWWPYLDPFFPDRSDYFIARTLTPEGTGEPQPVPHQINQAAYSGPMAVLINSGTRSGKESLAYQFVKTQRATVIGTTTAGAFTGGRGVFAERQADYLFFLSVLEMQLDGNRIEGVGVDPHILITPIPGEDAPLQKALQELDCDDSA